jgi:hypothetical protein
VGFAVDKVALGQVFSEYFGFPCQFSFHRLLLTHHLSSGAGRIGQLLADVPSGLSLTHHWNNGFYFSITKPDNKVRELATVCLPWQQWTETSVWFDDVYYLEVLKRLREKVRWKRTEFFANNSCILHHDNAPAHTALSVREFLASKQITVLEHPPYSPDLAPSDFFCSRK